MFDWRDSLRDSAGNLPPDLPPSGPDHPNVPVDHREDKGFFPSIGQGAKESVQDLAKAGSWALDKVGIHWYDDAIHRIDIDQHVAAEEKWNPYGEFGGSVLAMLSTTGINPFTGIPSLAGRLIPSATKLAARTAVAEKLLDIASKSELSAKNVYNGLKVWGFVTPVASNTASLVPFTFGASLNIDKNGVATLNTEQFKENLGRDLATVAVLHGAGKLLGFAFTKNSPIDIAKEELPTDLGYTYTPEIKEKEDSEVDKSDLEDTLQLKEKVEAKVPDDDIATTENTSLSKNMKDSLITHIENPPESDEMAFSINHPEESSYLIGKARDRAASDKESISTPYRNFISALISKFGVEINGSVRSIQDPETVSLVKHMDRTFKDFDKKRGVRKVFYTEMLNKRLQQLHKNNPKLHKEIITLVKRYTRPIGMQNLGAKEARADFSIDYNSGALHVDHPVYWLERNTSDIEHADEKRLEELEANGEKSANWLKAIINESDRSHSLNQKRNLLKEVIRAIENYKTPEEQEAIFEAQQEGFPEYGVSAQDADFNDTVREYERHLDKHKNPTSKFYTKLMTVLKDDNKKDAFFKYVECLVGA